MRLGRKPVRPGRVTIAVTLGTIGLFVISMAAGLGSWPFGAVGAAMLIVAVALLTTASMRGAEKAFVAGTVNVVEAPEPPVGVEYGRAEMHLLISAPGHHGKTVVMRDPRVPVDRWPQVGDTLPAMVAVDDPRRVKIQWDRVGYYDEATSDHGEQPAATGEPPASAVNWDDEDIPYSPTPDPTYAEDLLGVRPDVPLPRRTPGGTREPAEAAETAGSPVVVLGADPGPDESAIPGPRSSPEDVPPARPASAGAIQGVGITVLVTDLTRSLAFYRDLLGFYEVDGGDGNMVLASGATRIILRRAEAVEPVQRRLVHLNLEVGDVEAVYQELKVRGVRFTYAPRVVNSGERLDLLAAAFKDPDGHGIAITQWLAR